MTATESGQKTGRAVAGEELFENLAHFMVVHNGQSVVSGVRIPRVARFAEWNGDSAHAMKGAGFMVFDGLWTVDGTNLSNCDSDCGRLYGQA
ncbi:hypothetical protein [Streptomyces acidiscabies]|uniref:hypothetical protein n=1 Tax=Streptomyces acidiscabies TaxID=42234 RepID=UPI000964C2B0|nr:hypothetical protein [Streptomyces acidiscabies]GAV44634.1 hypothetical protein Saa2_07610 [Streptomyces acidiscabies]